MVKQDCSLLNRYFIVTSMEAGKVLDVVQITKYFCACKNKNGVSDLHKGECRKNYQGSRDWMKVSVQVFQCLEEEKKGKLSRYLGDLVTAILSVLLNPSLMVYDNMY